MLIDTDTDIDRSRKRDKYNHFLLHRHTTAVNQHSGVPTKKTIDTYYNIDKCQKQYVNERSQTKKTIGFVIPFIQIIQKRKKHGAIKQINDCQHLDI